MISYIDKEKSWNPRYKDIISSTDGKPKPSRLLAAGHREGIAHDGRQHQLLIHLPARRGGSWGFLQELDGWLVFHGKSQVKSKS